jgi:hypothetical protein
VAPRRPQAWSISLITSSCSATHSDAPTSPTRRRAHRPGQAQVRHRWRIGRPPHGLPREGPLPRGIPCDAVPSPSRPPQPARERCRDVAAVRRRLGASGAAPWLAAPRCARHAGPSSA